MIANSYHPFVAMQTWTRTRSAIDNLAAVGNSLKLCNIFPTRKLNSGHSIPQQKN